MSTRSAPNASGGYDTPHPQLHPPASAGTVEGVVGPRHCALCGEWPARETKNGMRCHLCECRDICAEHPVPMPGDSDNTELRELVDGAWPIVELWCAKSPEQIRWKRSWLARANALIGANPTENRAAHLVRGTVPPVVGPLD